MKPGYLYALRHPSDLTLVKVGRTTRTPERRLSEHNSDTTRVAGKIVQDTGLKWELKDSFSVPDPVFAEAVFWSVVAPGPFRSKVEVVHMPWEEVQRGLEAAKTVGERPASKTPDWVYAYTAWMKNRLEGRDISLVGMTTSRTGKSDYRCVNGHEWRTRSTYVADGEGCPVCGVGTRGLDDIWQTARLGYICLLVHPKNPGLVRIGSTLLSMERVWQENLWDDWQIHRHRFVEDFDLARALIIELIGHSMSVENEPIRIELEVAEQAIRDLIPRLHREIALSEIAKQESANFNRSE